MKKHAIYGLNTSPIISGTINSLTAATSATTIYTPWISTHFGNDEAAEIVCWQWVSTSTVGSGNMILDWQGTWDSGITVSSDTRLDGLGVMANGGQATNWLDGAVNLGATNGSNQLTGRAVGGMAAAGSGHGADAQGALPPYIRAVLHLGLWTSGIVVLYMGLYSRR
jgi:hypothetical protein